MQAIDAANPEQLRSSLHVGDKVEVNTTDGKLYKLEIVGMQPDGFTGKNDRGSGKILYRHIRSIERREFSSTKTTFLAAGLAAALALVIAITTMNIDCGNCGTPQFGGQ